MATQVEPTEKMADRRRLKAIMFDFDDTLVNLREASLIAFNTVLEKNGLAPITMESMLSTWDSSWRNVIEAVGPKIVDISELMTKIGREYMGHFEEIHLLHSQMLEGTPEVLKFVRGNGIKISIVSRRSRKAIQSQLEKFRLDELVDYIVGYDCVRTQKPSPEGLILAAAEFAVGPEECLSVGDSPSDIKAGKAFGSATCAVLTGPYDKRKIYEEKPDFIVDCIVRLPDVIHKSFYI